MPFFVRKCFYYQCDDCNTVFSTFDYYDLRDVRKLGWAISKDYKKCYCPACAPKRRNVGRPSWWDQYYKRHPEARKI